MLWTSYLLQMAGVCLLSRTLTIKSRMDLISYHVACRCAQTYIVSRQKKHPASLRLHSNIVARTILGNVIHSDKKIDLSKRLYSDPLKW